MILTIVNSIVVLMLIYCVYVLKSDLAELVKEHNARVKLINKLNNLRVLDMLHSLQEIQIYADSETKDTQLSKKIDKYIAECEEKIANEKELSNATNENA